MNRLIAALSSSFNVTKKWLLEAAATSAEVNVCDVPPSPINVK